MTKTKKNNLKLLLLASYANNLGWGIYSPLYGIFVLHLGGSSFEVSLIWGGYALIAGLLMMIFGKLENNRRYNPALTLLVGYGLFVAIAVGFLLINTVQQFYIVQLLLAVAMGIMTPAARTCYVRAQKRGHESGEWGLFEGGNYILMAIASFGGGALYKFGGFKAIFVGMLVIQIVCTCLAFRNYVALRKI